MGVLELIGGFSGGGIGSFIRGVINLLIGVLLLSAPMAAALAVPFVFAVLLLVQGVALVALAFRIRTRELRLPPNRLLGLIQRRKITPAYLSS